MKKEITAEELVKMEKEYNEKHLDYARDHYIDNLSFFAQKHIRVQYRILSDELKHELSKWQLTKFEMLMLLCYQGDLYEVFDKGDSIISQYPVNEMCKALDSVLIKAPSCTEVSVVYRQHKSNNVLDLKRRNEDFRVLFDSIN